VGARGGRTDPHLSTPGLIDDLLPNFQTSWPKLPNEVKQAFFTPEQIANADDIARNGQEAVKRIADNYALKADTIRRSAEDRALQLAARRQDLSKMTDRINAIKDQIRTATEASKATLNEQLARLQQQAQDARHAVFEATHQEKVELLKGQRVAQDVVDLRNRWTRIGWLGLAAGVGGKLGILSQLYLMHLEHACNGSPLMETFLIAHLDAVVQLVLLLLAGGILFDRLRMGQKRTQLDLDKFITESKERWTLVSTK